MNHDLLFMLAVEFHLLLLEQEFGAYVVEVIIGLLNLVLKGHNRAVICEDF